MQEGFCTVSNPTPFRTTRKTGLNIEHNEMLLTPTHKNMVQKIQTIAIFFKSTVFIDNVYNCMTFYWDMKKSRKKAII